MTRRTLFSWLGGLLALPFLKRFLPQEEPPPDDRSARLGAAPRKEIDDCYTTDSTRWFVKTGETVYPEWPSPYKFKVLFKEDPKA